MRDDILTERELCELSSVEVLQSNLDIFRKIKKLTDAYFKKRFPKRINNLFVDYELRVKPPFPGCIAHSHTFIFEATITLTKPYLLPNGMTVRSESVENTFTSWTTLWIDMFKQKIGESDEVFNRTVDVYVKKELFDNLLNLVLDYISEKNEEE